MPNRILVNNCFFYGVYALLFQLKHIELDYRIRELCGSLEAQIDEKLAAMDRHCSFSKYKTAPPGSAEREFHRLNYIDKAALHRDWCSDKEIPF